MRITELDEKSDDCMESRVSIAFKKEEQSMLVDIMSSWEQNVHDLLRDNSQEIELVYCKRHFDTLASINVIREKIRESALLDMPLNITYQQFDVLLDMVKKEHESVKKDLGRYGRSLMPGISESDRILNEILFKLGMNSEPILSLLYPKREYITSRLEDYIAECSYGGFLLKDDEVIHLHISMREKEDILQKIDSLIHYMEYDDGNCFCVEPNGYSFDIPYDDVEKVCNMFFCELTKNIYSGSIIPVSIHDYYVFLLACMQNNQIVA